MLSFLPSPRSPMSLRRLTQATETRRCCTIKHFGEYLSRLRLFLSQGCVALWSGVHRRQA